MRAAGRPVTSGVLLADEAGGWRAAPVVVACGACTENEWIAELDHAGPVRDVKSAEHDGGLRRAARPRVAVDAAGRIQLLRIRPMVRLRAMSTPRSREPVRQLLGAAA